MEPESENRFLFHVSEEQGARLDSFLAVRLPDLSRSRIRTLIEQGLVTVNGRNLKPSYRLKARDRVSICVPPEPEASLDPEHVDFDLIYEDQAVMVVNKPPGLVVHPSPGHRTGTLVHGLLHHCGRLSRAGGLTRPGIVHRLDKDTSGAMVIAKDDRTHDFLADQFKAGHIRKEYVALVHGRMEHGAGRIDRPIARHPRNRKQMSVAVSGGRHAVTIWELRETYQSGFSLLSVVIKTGRTHQIRVHLSHAGHPVAGDPVYGYKKIWWRKHPLGAKKRLLRPDRQMLHSERLGFVHPSTGSYREFYAPLPEDMVSVIRRLRLLNAETAGQNEVDKR